jgi:hypothetical protein
VRIQHWQPSGTFEVPGKGEFPQRFAAHAFDNCVGKDVPFKIEGVERGRATVVAVEVAEDGSGATWTVDIDGGGHLMRELTDKQLDVILADYSRELLRQIQAPHEFEEVAHDSWCRHCGGNRLSHPEPAK